MPIPQSEAAATLNRRFPQADAVLVEDLAAHVALGRITMEQAAKSLREMGCTESIPPPPPAAQTAQQPPLQPPRLQSSTPIYSPAPGNMGGEAPPPVKALAGRPPQEVNRWVEDQARFVPAQGLSIDEWQQSVTLPARPAAPSTASAAPPVTSQQLQQQRNDAVAPAPSKRQDPSSPLVAAAVTASNGGAAAASTPVAYTQHTAAAAEAASEAPEIRLYMTTMTADRQVRDRVRGFERLLFLLAIPHQAYDVSDNRFMRRKLVELCDGEDRGLPLLFVGDRLVGVYDEVQEMVDLHTFIPRLVSLGAVLPAQVLEGHTEKQNAAALAELSPSRRDVVPLSPPTSPHRNDSITEAPQQLQQQQRGDYERRLQRLLEML